VIAAADGGDDDDYDDDDDDDAINSLSVTIRFRFSQMVPRMVTISP